MHLNTHTHTHARAQRRIVHRRTTLFILIFRNASPDNYGYRITVGRYRYPHAALCSVLLQHKASTKQYYLHAKQRAEEI